MITLDDLPRLRRNVENLRRRRDEARGRVKQIFSRLRTEFGVKTPKDAKRVLARLEVAERKIAVRYTRAKKLLERDFPEVLDEGKPDPFLRDMMKRQQKAAKKWREENETRR